MNGYIALGLDHQGRRLPTMVARQLLREDRAGVCDTCPGELDRPEAVYQAEPGEPGYWQVIGRMAGVGLAAVAALHVAGRLGLLP
ncbi:hypothetical protein [Roseateles terrae]|uniref:Uncharacterized protein n=1 Tax=Roseateles terrae TaxID=431060 RepID=A0ABR6GQL5_9BURK|nr:hypothetical protein [Roseateles terrae]MBB3193977.1 hypothetical protein [Roseateles terrae]OWQ87852.1 hypothetical protein CDN98_06715 [Roseateles terrae]